ncbi:hypothetical protein Q760_12730 [Cellulomonas cellasea DSM 20118]|uniref:Uncharacterized protein n=2 Tax=Cellulomonas cellasea TaxID=43670 RepID=A0A0A0BB82_9CELL|nr:hypothetical protein Q760_12730 [Cellulomonas cellasea DSM 20118]GEA88882.1 hypothetical protein CCE01nite_28310 [Cellulomonas cellasea]
MVALLLSVAASVALVVTVVHDADLVRHGTRAAARVVTIEQGRRVPDVLVVEVLETGTTARIPLDGGGADLRANERVDVLVDPADPGSAVLADVTPFGLLDALLLGLAVTGLVCLRRAWGDVQRSRRRGVPVMLEPRAGRVPTPARRAGRRGGHR